MNQYLQQFLKKMMNTMPRIDVFFPKVVQSTLSPESAFKLASKTSKLLHMNELEIIYWSLILDQNPWIPSAIALERHLLLTAFQAKVSAFSGLSSGHAQ